MSGFSTKSITVLGLLSAAIASAAVPASPVLVSPRQTTPTNQPTLVWNSVADATSYEVTLIQTTTKVVTVPVTACNAGVCSYTWTSMLPAGNAWWAVRAANADGLSRHGEYPYFYVPLPAGPVAISPIGLVTTDRPVFRWNAHANVTGYEFKVEDGRGVQVALQTLPTTICTGTPSVCSFDPGRNLREESNWFWVRSLGGPVGPSAFTITGFIPTAALPAAPTAISPKGIVSNTRTPTYQWAVITGAQEYTFYMADELGVVVAETRLNPNQRCTTTVCSYTPTQQVAINRNTWWWVNARTASLWGPYTRTGFRYSPTPLAAPATVSPTGTITTTVPQFVFVPVAGAASYDLYVVGSTVLIPERSFPTSICSGGTCTASPGVTLPRGNAWWYVRARDSSNSPGTWSAARAITVSPPLVSAPTLVSPTGVQSSRSLTYVWNGVTGAASYQLYVADATGARFQGTVTATCSGTPLVCSAAPTIALNAGSHWWWVRSVDSAGSASAWSSSLSFSVP